MHKGFMKMMAIVLALLFVVSQLYVTALATNDSDPDVFGVFEENSTYEVGTKLTDSFYYTDAWFEAEPETRNDALALISMQMVAAAVDNDANGSGAALLKQIGFEQVGFHGFGSEDPDDCAYTWGTKRIDDYTLVTIVVQSSALDKETKTKGWTQNFIVNDETCQGEHAAFAKAANKALDGIVALGVEGKVKYWITGQSRGGALANLIAAKLPAILEEQGAVNAGIYAYTFESPAVVDADLAQDGFNYIHNYLCYDDIVTKIPMWGMTRYGNAYELKTEETDNGLKTELEKLGSPAIEREINDVSDEMNELVDKLAERVSLPGDGSLHRADYSKLRNDKFTSLTGEEIEISYTYQDTFRPLMKMIFNGELGELSELLSDLLGKIPPAVLDLAEGVKREEQGDVDAALPYYWSAAIQLHDVLEEMSGNPISMNDQDFYALLRVIGPLIVDTSCESEIESSEDAILYIVPVFDLVLNAASFTYSHHFDTLIARLKTLAPQPLLPSIDLAIEEPKANDAGNKTPDEVIEKINGWNNPWLTVEETSWIGLKQAIEDNSVYYLHVKLKAVGHQVTQDNPLSLNNKIPVQLDTYYHDGTSVIDAVFEYSVGDPETVNVSFEMGKNANAPETMAMPKGKMLRYTDTLETGEEVTEDGKTWRLVGWQDAQGNDWSEIVVNGDITLYAKWIQVIDDIRVTFNIPKDSEAFGAPEVAEGSPYVISEYNISDESYNMTEVAKASETYHINVFINPVGENVFATEMQEEDWLVFAGKGYANDEEVEASYEEYDDVKQVLLYWEFTVPAEEELEPETPEQVISYGVMEGEGAKWTKGTQEDITVVLERTGSEEEAIGHFQGIEVDGNNVDQENYLVTSGSVVIRLKAAYLETLAVGEHALKALFDDGSVTTNFVIEEAAKTQQPDKTTPRTEDDTNLSLWMWLLVVSIGASSGIMALRTSNR